MKIHSIHLQFGLCLAVWLPLPSHAGMEVPYWLYPEWIASKVMDFHTRNTERSEQAQLVTQAKNNPNGSVSMSPNTANPPNILNTEPNQRKTNLAPVENANVKVNEKYLSKEELIELRKQLRQK